MSQQNCLDMSRGIFQHFHSIEPLLKHVD